MDTIEQIKILAEKALEDGTDIGTLLQHVNALAEPDKTSLGLNLWKSSDKPKMQDFNQDNITIDDALQALNNNKMEKDSAIAWQKLEMANGFESSGAVELAYSKDNSGWVQVCGSFTRSGAPLPEEAIAQLPEGFRPSKMIPVTLVQAVGANGAPWACTAWVKPDGFISMTSVNPPNTYNPNVGTALSVVFKAAIK